MPYTDDELDDVPELTATTGTTCDMDLDEVDEVPDEEIHTRRYDIGPSIQRFNSSVLDNSHQQFSEEVLLNDNWEEATFLRSSSSSSQYRFRRRGSRQTQYQYFMENTHREVNDEGQEQEASARSSSSRRSNSKGKVKVKSKVKSNVNTSQPPAPSLFPSIIPLEFDPVNGGIPLLPDYSRQHSHLSSSHSPSNSHSHSHSHSCTHPHQQDS